MEIWTAFILGLAGSVHCAGMCGPLALALPPAAGGVAARVLNRSLYNLGRIITYGLLGILFGLIGKSLALAGVQRWFSIAIGVIILVGLVAGQLDSLTHYVAGPVNQLKAMLGVLLRQRSAGALFMFGLLNGLLPCGLVYVACAGATATGGIASAVEYMVAFGLGTTPMMLALSLAGSLIPAATRLKLQKLIPICVGLVALLLILRGLALGIPYLSPDCAAGLHGKSCCH
jgi:sulfite exporter TauE/SafE